MARTLTGTAYEVAGNPRHPVIVLIHGLGLRQAMWRDYVHALAADYFVLTYDLLGHGAQSTPVAQPSLRLFSQQLKSLLDEVKIKSASLVGFSLGGMINRRFAMDYPEYVQSLIILNSPHERHPEEQRRVELRAMQTAKDGPAATIDETLERWFTADYMANNTSVVQRVKNWVLANDMATYAQCRFVLAAGVKELIRPEPPIWKPSLIATCEYDRGSTPAMSYAIAAEINQAKTIIVPRLKHLGLLENPALFLELIEDFLTRYP